MLTIQLQNVQAITEAAIEIPDNSIVEFTGENSNGKSIISKVIERLTAGDLRNKDIRRTIIKDGCDTALILFTSKEWDLLLNLTIELAGSRIGLRRVGEEQWIIRPLSDSDGCAELIYMFGFRTYSKGDICLQLAPTFGAIPFITTSGATNAEIVQDITTDKVADEFLQTFKNITFPLLKDTLARKKTEAAALQTVLDNLHPYDWEVYEELQNKIRPVYFALRDYNEIEIADIPIPFLKIYPYKETVINNIPVINVYNIFDYINNPESEIENYIEIMNGRCPTCGKPLMEGI